MKSKYISWPLIGVIILGIMGLVGYLPGMGLLGSIREGYIPMAPSTAICFIVLGMVLVMLHVKHISRVKILSLQIITLCVTLFGILEIAGYFTGSDLSFEDRIVPAVGMLNGVPLARMSPVTGAGFLLSGISIFFITIKKKTSVNNKFLEHSVISLGVLILLIGFLFCLAYLYGTPLFYKHQNVIPMALTTAFGFLLVAVAVISSNQNAFLLRLLIGTSTRSYLLRFILPLSTLSIVLGGMMVILSAQSSDMNPAIFSAALTVLVAIVAGFLATLLSHYMGDSIDRSKAEALKSNEALLESEARLRTLIDTLPDYVWLKNVDGIYLFCNSKVENFFGVKVSEVIGKTDYDFVDKQLADFFREKDNEAIVSGKACINEEEIILSDGGRKEILETIKKPVFSVDGTLYGVLGIARDITERKKSEKELQDSERRFRSIFSQTFQFAGIVSIDGILTAANKNSLDFIGEQEADVIGKPFWDTPWWTHSEEMRVWLQDAIKRTAKGETIQHEVTHCSSLGEIHYFDFSLKPIVDERGKVQYLIPESRDITERKHAAEVLKNKEFEQREILNFMTDSVISIDQDGIVLTYNNAAEMLFGYTSDEIIGQSINKLMPGPNAGNHDHYMRNFMETDEPHIIGVGREVEGQRKNKENFPLRISVAELPKGVDGKRRFIGSCHDLTLHKQQEEQLRRSQKMDALGKLTSGVAHDFNNMLGVVMGYANLLEGSFTDQQKLAKYAHEIHHAGERGAKLTRKLLAFSRHIASDEELININVLLLDQQDMLEKALTARIKLVLELSEDLWSVWIDDADFEDAVLNLSINAMHAMEEGGQLIIRTSNEKINRADAYYLHLDEGDYAVLSIIDTGCGMDEKTKAKIFEPFYSTKGDKGTGLGLSQVYGFVERSGGAISVYSKPEEGTRFVLYFPRYHDNKESKKSENVKNVTNYSGKETILIVDDEPGLLFLASETLSNKGYKTFCAKDAKQALEILENESIDLLLSDIIMHGMDGYKLAAIVQDKYPAVKIQLTSGFDGDHRETILDHSLHQKLLNKPYSSQVLLQRIRELFDE